MTNDLAACNPTRGAARPRSHLFSVRLWREQVAGGSEYRGSVRDVISGAFCSFREWSDLAAFMIEQMEEDQPGQSEQGEPAP